MSLRSLNHILGAIDAQSSFLDQQFQRIVKYWPEAVGAAVAIHTRPNGVGRGVLSVATSSSAWAQTLTFERQRILEKLNLRLSTPLVDIRFSTAGWQRHQSKFADGRYLSAIWREHPSQIVDKPLAKIHQPTAHSPNAAFQRWAKMTQTRMQGLPLCPNCQCPTPEGELKRWGVCSICAAKQW